MKHKSNIATRPFERHTGIKDGDLIDQQVVNLPQIVGKGYATFWNFEGRYRVVKGSRASKKSTTTAMNIIYRMMKHPQANTLVVRKTFRTHKDSTYAQLKWAINRLGVSDYWRATVNPLELTYLPTQQKILFRGFDDPMKLTSLTVAQGFVTWVWIEEAYEIMSEEDFKMLDESIRGKSGGIFKQITLTLNPWSDRHWIKKRFFDEPNDDNKLALTTNYMCNEWLDEADKHLFEQMKLNNPRRYQVAGLGEWGITEGLIYNNWQQKNYRVKNHAETVTPNGKWVFGLDFGYSNDPTAFIVARIDMERKRIIIWDEIYKKGMSNEEIYQAITDLGYSKEIITADSASPKDIDRLRTLGLTRIRPARKGKDSILNGINFLQEFEILVRHTCNNFMTEITNYQWDVDRFDNRVNKPIDNFNHLLDALRYATESEQIDNTVTLKGFRKGII